MRDHREEPLLCRMASKLALHGPSMEYRGVPAKGVAPTSGANDAMLAFSHAHRRSPVGWTIFEVKYLEDPSRQQKLINTVVADLPDTPHRRDLAALVCCCFCSGDQLSRRSLRRELGVDRVTAGQYYESARRSLYWLRTIEHEFARLVRRGMA